MADTTVLHTESHKNDLSQRSGFGVRAAFFLGFGPHFAMPHPTKS
jgi:hypothetical protein